MKVILFKWSAQTTNLPSWFEHYAEIEISDSMLKELFDSGNNVMVRHNINSEGLDKPIVYVDNGYFIRE